MSTSRLAALETPCISSILTACKEVSRIVLTICIAFGIRLMLVLLFLRCSALDKVLEFANAVVRRGKRFCRSKDAVVGLDGRCELTRK